MKLFLSIFFAILAAAAVIGAGLLAKERLDNWKLELQSCNARGEMLMASVRALTPSYSSPTSLDDAMTRVYEAQANLKRIEELAPEFRALDARIRFLLEHKPFGLPLTASEQRQLDEYKHALADGKAAIATLAKPTPTPDESMKPAQETYPQDQSMKPTTDVSEAERQRRRKAQQRETQNTYPHAKAVSPREMVTTPTPTPHL
jgi:hypothetical protein